MTNKLGEALRVARGKTSCRAFAQKIGISHTHYKSIEEGRDQRTGKAVNISCDIIEKLANATGLDAMWLFRTAIEDRKAVKE